VLESENYKVFQGSNLDVLPTLPENSVDAIVTDPPYELGFMGKSWDSSGIAYSVELWRECLRVLKPGGHLLAFGGSRTWHRLAVAIEDSGFEMRDSIAWLYGSGFPKSMDVSKAIDKAAGIVRDRVPTNEGIDSGAGNYGGGSSTQLRNGTKQVNVAATDEAKNWTGWGTALKPAFEPIVVARKPLVGTVAANVLLWGVGGLNIDGSRIGTGDDRSNGGLSGESSIWGENNERTARPTGGRWPANIILDEYTAGLLDEQSGFSVTKRQENPSAVRDEANTWGGTFQQNRGARGHSDSGGASRFFYVAKASKKDRNEGLEDLEGREVGAKGNGLARTCSTCSPSVLNGCECPDRTFVNPTRKNFHPTVKPTALMTYLIKLVAPEGSTILDPFTGSGSTGKAALLNGYKFIGIELTEEYLPIIKGRLDHAEETYKQTKEEESGTLF
jgi:site-specific DNA-methyltransferase (adenine-specific)